MFAFNHGIPGLYVYFDDRNAGWFSKGEIKFGAFDGWGPCW
jgi:hypothetical protein